MNIGDALLNFAKKHGLKIIEIIFGIGSPVTAISTIAKMIGLDDKDIYVDSKKVYCHGDQTDTLGVAYGNMAGLFIEAIKELKAEVDSLKAQLESVKNG